MSPTRPLDLPNIHNSYIEYYANFFILKKEWQKNSYEHIVT